ncbi:PAS domain-containing sensor histidine kinase [Geomonas sp. RF6]|uniref:sensor histidine kinase n=1 Tax=Geomonas sp. RF6 TaxID=2897342 RepID=UPI001E4A518A|nr:PAS domain-containing sensor histidine kinase [Geomonas sp. RF6]UFS72318.1 PAS domain-containing sensor histidine kinase [Geomonas sp. RF6]
MSAQGDAVAAMLLEKVDSGVVYTDQTGTIVLLNRRAEEILQVPRGEVVGRRVDMLPLRTHIYRMLSENCRDIPVEMSVDGAIVAVHSTPLGDNGSAGEMYELRDITAVRQEMRQREEFVAMMTHDLKSPLTVITGYIQTLTAQKEERIDPTLHLCVQEMEKSAGKMLAMIDDVLDAYRLEAGLLQIDKSPCDLGGILEACCSDGARDAQVHGSSFEKVITHDLPVLRLDGKQIGRVFANLIGNAVKFTPRRGSISVHSAVEEKDLVVEVKDTGIGIAQDELPLIFNKYYRSSSAQGFKGTGLGLTISKAIVEAHGGSISVESQSGGGSRFSVRIPLEGNEANGN